MGIKDTKLTKMIMNLFAGRPIRLFPSEGMFLYNMKVYSYNQYRHLSIIRLDYRPDAYECARVNLGSWDGCSEPELFFSVEDVVEWLSKQSSFLDGNE